MNRPDLVAAVAERTGRSRKDVDEVLRTVTDVVVETVAAGHPVAIHGFAKFTPVDRGPRQGRNPHTGEPVPIPAARGVRVKVGQPFKDAVAGSAPS